VSDSSSVPSKEPADPSPSRAKRADWRRVATTGALLACTALLLWDAAPETRPDFFFDSKAYILWPETMGAQGQVALSKRPPSYPLTLDVLGHRALLGWVQAYGLLASFMVLGWVVAGGAGAVGFGLLSRAFPIASWSGAVLTESLTLSVLALLLAIALCMAEWVRVRGPASGRLDRRTLAALGASAFGVAYFTFLRDANFLLLPLFAIAFLHGPKKPALLAGALACALVATSIVLSERESRWHPNIATAINVRMRADPDAFAELRATGMPALSFTKVTPEMAQWMDESGRRHYQRWVFTRAASYAEPVPRLVGRDAPEHVRAHYFENAPRSGLVTRTGNVVWQLLTPPFWLWLGLLAVPAIEWRRRRSVSAVGAMAAWCVPITYGFAFATYHAAAIEATRHMLAGLVLYRLATAFGLVALVRALRSQADAAARGPNTSS